MAGVSATYMVLLCFSSKHIYTSPQRPLGLSTTVSKQLDIGGFQQFLLASPSPSVYGIVHCKGEGAGEAICLRGV